MPAHKTVELIGHTHHRDQQGQVHQHTDKGIGTVHKGEDHAAEEDGHHDDHKEEAGAAAGMVLGLGADIVHRQRQARLVAEDGLMLGAVVGKDPLDVLLPGAEDQVGQKQRHLHHALDQVQKGGMGDPAAQETGDQGRQHHEKAHRHAHRQHHSHGDQHALQLLCRDMLFQPLIQLIGLGALLLGEIVRREHEGLDAVDHGA